MATGKIYHYFSFMLRSMLILSGRGSLIIHNGKAAGILAFIFYNNATGIAVSLNYLNKGFKNILFF